MPSAGSMLQAVLHLHWVIFLFKSRGETEDTQAPPRSVSPREGSAEIPVHLRGTNTCCSHQE